MGTASNLKHAAVSFLVPLPSILFYLYFINHYKTSTVDGTALSPFWSWCVDHPLLLVNALFFFNVNVLFWIISQIQKSHWVCYHVISVTFSNQVLFLFVFLDSFIEFCFVGAADDRFVLDCDTNVARLLLCNIPFGPI